MSKRTVQSYRRDVVDSKTGEVYTVETEKVFTEKITTETFFNVYLNYIKPFYGIDKLSTFKVLLWMCEHSEFNTGVVQLPTAVRKQIMEELDITRNTLSTSIKYLKEHQVIAGDQGLYTINPEIIWKGNMNTRRQFLENKDLQVTFKLIDKESE